MHKVVVAIVFGFIVLAVVFLGIGGSFNRQFWLSFLPGLMENMAILAVAVFVIERIFKKESIGKLERTNAEQSRFVRFLSNRLAFLLLEHLGLASDKEIGKDSALDFEFARNRFKGTDLTAAFYGKLMESKDREIFTEGLTTILSRETELVAKALDGIYPRPDPEIKQILSGMNYSIGAVEAFKMVFGAFAAANEQVGADDRLRTEHLDLLVKICYRPVSLELQNLQSAVLRLTEKAGANELFMSLD